VSARAAILAGLLLALGCVVAAPIAGRPCPCEEGYACCRGREGAERCVRQEDLAALACEGHVDGAAVATAVDAGTDDARAPAADAVSPDAPPDAAAPSGAPRCANGASGLQAIYYATDRFSGDTVERLEPALAFDSFSFLRGALPTEGHFTALFGGELLADASVRHGFMIVSSGAVRLWIGDQLVIDAWTAPCCAGGVAASVPLEAGKRYRVLVELYARGRATPLALYWKKGEAPSWSAVPTCALFPAPPPAPTTCPTTFADCVPAGTPACSIQIDNGVRGTYYATEDLSGPGQSQVESFLSSGWLAVNAPLETRSVRWETELVAPTRERYTLYLAARGRTRLLLDGQVLLQTPGTSPLVEEEVPVELVQSRHNRLVVEQTLGGERFFARLRWASPTLPRATIPACRFYLPSDGRVRHDGGAFDGGGP
jgi:hypothetical protein